MFTTLRSRLWLTYALLIFLALAVFGVSIAASLWNSPILYRSTVQSQRLVLLQLSTELKENEASDLFQAEAYLNTQAAARDDRYLLYDRARLVFDSGSGEQPPLRPVRLNRAAQDLPFITGWVRAVNGGAWIYSGIQLENGTWLLSVQPRPRLALINILRDEIVRPLLLSGLITLVFAMLLAGIFSRQVSAPLKKLSDATKALAGDAYPKLPLEGLDEVRDLVSNFNQMGKKIQQNQESQREFLANVSHELKTPLTSIRGFAQAILDGTAQSSDDLLKAADIIHQESGRMHRLVEELLELSRLETGAVVIQQDLLDLTPLLAKLVDPLKLIAEKQEIGLSIEVNQSLWVSGDGDRLVQVFTNLIDNALKFTPAGGAVKVSGMAESGWVTIRVTDTGPGIPLEERERVFERFYQLDKARSGGVRRGAGLGLSIAREIVRAHAGEIRVESTPNQGSTFCVRLPEKNKQEIN